VATGEADVRVEVVGVFEQGPEEADQQDGAPVVVLRYSQNRELHVSVSSCEGLAIHLALGQHVVSRPLTHDLALRLLERLSTRLTRVVVDDADGICCAKLLLSSAEGELWVEARPGDGIALALRAEVPIYASEHLLARANRPGEGIS